MRAKRYIAFLLGITLGLLLHLPAVAEVALYDDLAGDNVLFTNISEESNTDPLPLFDAPIVSGDALSFNPTAFRAPSEGGVSNATTSILTVDITAKPGLVLESIVVHAQGDFTLAGIGGVGTSALADMQGIVMLLETLAGPATGPEGLDTDSVSFNLLDDGVTIPGEWETSLEMDLAALGLPSNTTKVRIELTLALESFSEATSAANMAVKDVVAVSATAVPEPATLGMLLAGAGTVLFRRRSLTTS